MTPTRSLAAPTATILAGGLSRRMFAAAGGEGRAHNGDKGLLELGGQSMIARVIRCVMPQTSAVVLNANGDPARFEALALPVVADPIAGFVGPLAGVLAGMRWTAANHPAVTHTLTVSSDAPFLPGDLVARLSAALIDRPSAIAVASSGGELHPVIGLWPVAHADDLHAALQAGVRKVLAWTDRHGTVPVAFPFLRANGREIDPFFNANTPEELADARRLLDTLAS
jgi:molybdenum cofactor guanylyltransferase